MNAAASERGSGPVSRSSAPAHAIVSALLLTLAACRSIDAGHDTVEQVEHRRFAAMVAQDVAALEPMLAEELNYTHSSGEVENKPQFLETIRSGRLRYQALEVQRLDVRLYDDLALLTGHATARVQIGGKPLELDLRFTDAYVNRDGRWQLIAWQSTRVQQ